MTIFHVEVDKESKNYKYDENSEILEVETEGLEVGSYKIFIKYQGTHGDQLLGFYKSKDWVK